MNSAAQIQAIAESPTEPASVLPRLTAHTAPAVVARPSFWAAPDARRALNVLAAVLLLVVAAPLMLLIAIAIRLTSPGPVIFRQTRVGLDRRTEYDSFWQSRRQVDYGGRLFTMYKFRTMRHSDQAHVQIWAQPGDERITAVGRVLRKYRLDELPQVINVLMGDMNIVGPRPEQPTIFASLREQVDSYSHRQRVLPGITGWAQVNQSYDTSVADVKRKVKLDLEYIQGQSVWRDVKILFLTIPVMLFRRGAI
jgi:lipopolysaccharide/colanic/teichoic acid biosynthesis glycosyltransferase